MNAKIGFSVVGIVLLAVTLSWAVQGPPNQIAASPNDPQNAPAEPALTSSPPADPADAQPPPAAPPFAPPNAAVPGENPGAEANSPPVAFDPQQPPQLPAPDADGDATSPANSDIFVDQAAPDAIFADGYPQPIYYPVYEPIFYPDPYYPLVFGCWWDVYWPVAYWGYSPFYNGPRYWSEYRRYPHGFHNDNPNNNWSGNRPSGNGVPPGNSSRQSSAPPASGIGGGTPRSPQGLVASAPEHAVVANRSNGAPRVATPGLDRDSARNANAARSAKALTGATHAVVPAATPPARKIAAVPAVRNATRVRQAAAAPRVAPRPPAVASRANAPRIQMSRPAPRPVAAFRSPAAGRYTFSPPPKRRSHS
jgi:hypothetical protein